MKNTKNADISNIYRLDGQVPIMKAIPFGLQHILAMFVANLTPITIIAGAGGLKQAEIAILLQNAMFVAGIATLIQLYPVWKIGSRLPIVMGVSFTFVTVLSTVAANYGYPAVVGAVMIGGIMEGTLGLLAKYWKKIISPIVAASVVTAIGFSLFTVGTRSFGGGYSDDFGSAQNLILGTITLLVCLIWNIKAKGYWKQLSVLAGLIVGYIVAVFMGKVDLSVIFSGGIISFPKIMPYAPEFNPGAIFSVAIIFLVSAAETIGDTTAMVSGGLDRDITTEEISGSLACDGYASVFSSCLGCPPVTSFSQECRTYQHDKGRKPFHHHDRCRLHDPGRTASSCRKLFCFPSGFCSRRMYYYDVWNHPDFRNPDDSKSRFYPEEYYHRCSFSFHRYWIYHSKRNRYLAYFPGNTSVCIFRKCSCCCICNGNYIKLNSPKRYGD